MNRALFLALAFLIAFLPACTSDSTKTDTQAANQADSLAPDPRNAAEFDDFIGHFLQTTYWNTNLDSLVYNQSNIVTQFYHPGISFVRFHNPGVYCVVESGEGFGYPFSETYHGDMGPKPLDGRFKDVAIVEGFCEESSNKDGVYWTTVTTFPDYWNHDVEKSFVYQLPTQFKNNTVNRVDILQEGYIVQTFYFMKDADKWYLIILYDCDCSA